MRRLGLGLAVALVVAFSLGPFAWIVLTSLKSEATIAARPPTVVPDFEVGFYRTAFERHDLLRYAANSAVVAGATTLVTVVLGALAAYALVRLRVPFAGALLGLVLAAAMFPQVAIAGGIHRLLLDWGLLNTRAGLVLPYVALGLPLAIWVLTAFFRRLPREVEEAAWVDGCGPVATLVRVVLPMAAPGVFTAAILVFILSWNEFFLALLITTDPAVQTLPVGIAKFPGEHRVPWGELAAAAVVATGPLVLLVVFLQRRIVRGLTAGAVK